MNLGSLLIGDSDKGNSNKTEIWLAGCQVIAIEGNEFILTEPKYLT